jgi:AAA15 family ATPase/GTPase
MFTKLRIQNYKSIHDLELELGRVNVFIGENGCGKSNILEAVALLSTAGAGRLKNNDLAAKGIRVTRPNMMVTAFDDSNTKEHIDIELYDKSGIPISIYLGTDNLDDINSEWIARTREEKPTTPLKIKLDFTVENKTDQDATVMIDRNFIRNITMQMGKNINRRLAAYIIYELQTNILRGFNKQSLEIPGRHGENLDMLLSTFDESKRNSLLEYANFIHWLDEEGIIIDLDGKLAKDFIKLRSESFLYLRDKFMAESKNTFSIENANEGALHILFYLALLISDKTPPFFAIDNIENALNPKLCRELVKNLVLLSKENDKQSLITTHNPAVLDGLNLHDDEQRLFVVRRNKKGHTTVKRVQLKPDVEVGGHRLKLSELWMRGQLGGLPQNF